jgi:AraC-like DNA-binding protein
LPLISAITEHIDENLEKDLALDQLAAAFHLSYTHLCRLFKKETGSTIHSYIVEQRLNQAVKLLMFTDKNIRYIVDACGFPNQKILFVGLQKQIRHDAEALPRREQGIIRP